MTTIARITASRRFFRSGVRVGRLGGESVVVIGRPGAAFVEPAVVRACGPLLMSPQWTVRDKDRRRS